jgi:hypothetical protein
MTRSAFRAPVLALVPALLLASGCGGGGTGAVRSPAFPRTGASTAAANPAEKSALDDFLGAGRAITSDGREEAAARKQEELIARCMADQGFDYVPVDVSGFTVKEVGGAQVVSIGKPSFPDLPADQFAARFGYGITTAPSKKQQPDAFDKNAAIVDKLSVAGRVAYYQALYGRATPLDSQGNLTTSINTSAGSCSDRAAKAVPSDAELNSVDRKVERVRTTFGALLDRVSALRDDELKDPRVVQATQAWSGCLAASGFPGFEDLEAPHAAILREARALIGHNLDRAPSDPTALAALRRREVTLAVADNTCHQTWDTTFAAVRTDLESQFVAQNKAELTSYRSALAAASR